MKDELIKLFCSKINLELGRYKKRMLKMTPEEIYGSSYQIECMVNCHPANCLMPLSQNYSAVILQANTVQVTFARDISED